MEISDLTWDGILLRLKEYGVKFVYAYYSGGGDSGAIDEWKFFGDHEDIEFTSADEAESPSFSGFDTTEQLELESHIRSEIENLVSDEFYSVLNNVEDWYNNDGGWGEMVLNVDTGKYVVDNNCYISQTENYMHGGQFESHI